MADVVKDEAHKLERVAQRRLQAEVSGAPEAECDEYGRADVLHHLAAQRRRDAVQKGMLVKEEPARVAQRVVCPCAG